MEQRQQFIDEYMHGESSMSELARRFGVSRKTLYKWVARFMATSSLVDQSRRPRHSPRALADAMESAIVAARRERPRWGPKKLRAALVRANPGVDFPSTSTFALVLRRNGLITPRRRRRRTPPSTGPLSHATRPNALWCMDFKGDFLVGKRRCYPLTVTDAHSRFLLACVALSNTRVAGVKRVLRQVFAEFGLPDAIRTDNGSPFASRAPGGLSELSVWWAKLGITHERVEPGKPQQNGRHERMHLTLKLDTASPPSCSKRSQQRAFDIFRKHFNVDRPHEALGQRSPVEFYERSSRALLEPYWGRDFTYPEEFEVARVLKNGRLPWNDRTVFVTTTLRHELLGLSWNGKAWDVFFGRTRLGLLRRCRNSLRFVRADDIQLTARVESDVRRPASQTFRDALRSDLTSNKGAEETVTHVSG